MKLPTLASLLPVAGAERAQRRHDRAFRAALRRMRWRILVRRVVLILRLGVMRSRLAVALMRREITRFFSTR